ncbi:MAG TPA: hypothetical protein VMV86_04090, partial [Methanosarcinales archaeon]|nr:hypothetical protein [Methanosarcinales archaeon]
SHELGSFLSYGKRLFNLNDTKSYCWRHEHFGPQNPLINVEKIPLEGNKTITRSFFSPYISWFAFNPFGKPAGEDRWIELKRIEFDFHNLKDLNQTFLIQLISREYMGVIENSSIIPFSIRNQPKLDLNIEGKSISMFLSSDVYYEMGNTMLLIDSGDGQ